MAKLAGYILIFAVAVLFVLLYARWFEWSNIYFPMNRIEATPSSIGLPYEDIYFTTSDGVRLNGWFIPAGRPRATVIFFHGNAGNISHRMDIIRMLNGLELNIFIIDYRGYGRSGGIPSEKGTYLDALAAYEYLRARDDIDKEKIILYGKSLGGAVAIELASKVPVFAVITDSVFTSTIDIGKEIYPFLPLDLFVTMKYDSVSRVGNVSAPKLIIHSREDEIIPFHHGERIFENTREPREFFPMKGSHNEGFLIYEEEYVSRIDDFLRKQGLGGI